MEKFTSLLMTTGFVLLLSGCSLTIGTNPDAYPFPSEQVFAVRPGVSAHITNFYTKPEVVELQSNVYCDLKHFTETALTMVQRELGKKGVAMSPSAEKTVVLKVAYPSLMHGMWSMRGRLTLQATLGNGKTVMIDVNNKTSGNAMRAFNGALLKAVTGLLQDKVFEAYMNETWLPEKTQDTPMIQ